MGYVATEGVSQRRTDQLDRKGVRNHMALGWHSPLRRCEPRAVGRGASSGRWRG
jgi:hypothetical protein